MGNKSLYGCVFNHNYNCCFIAIPGRRERHACSLQWGRQFGRTGRTGVLLHWPSRWYHSLTLRNPASQAEPSRGPSQSTWGIWSEGTVAWKPTSCLKKPTKQKKTMKSAMWLSKRPQLLHATHYILLFLVQINQIRFQQVIHISTNLSKRVSVAFGQKWVKGIFWILGTSFI